MPRCARSPEQMTEFKKRLQDLSAALRQAEATGDPAPLRTQFGSDFPVT